MQFPPVSLLWLRRLSPSIKILRDRPYCRQGCNPQLNHAMLLVGYNRGSGPGKADAYWIVKNSWGTE